MSLFVLIQREYTYPSTVVAHLINFSKRSGCVGRWAATGFNINNYAFPCPRLLHVCVLCNSYSKRRVFPYAKFTD